MATVVCPGCGLPRGESEIEKPCPVCASAPALKAVRTRDKTAEPDPTAGMAADASELHTPRPLTGEPRSRWALVGAVAFAAGTLCGVGGVLGFHSLDRAKAKPDEPEVAEKRPEPAPPTKVAPPAKIEVAPMPHEPVPELLPFGPDSDLDPDVKVVQIQPPGLLTPHAINMPADVYSVPVMKKGEHVVLKGKVKSLRVHGLDAGAMLDASDLEAATIIVTGKIDGRSTLKLKAPNGAVNLSAKVDGRSDVTINAPGGDVVFTGQTTPTRDGSKIDNGSTVTITARTVVFKGDIAGTDTRVSVTLTRNALLRVGAVTGKAVVEYKSLVAGWAVVDVSVGSVAPTATFRKLE